MMSRFFPNKLLRTNSQNENVLGDINECKLRMNEAFLESTQKIKETQKKTGDLSPEDVKEYLKPFEFKV